MTVQMSAVGGTARWIAAARALETESETPLFSDPYGRALAGDDGFALLDQMRSAMGPNAPATGPDLYLSLRTRVLDDGVLNTVRERGITQVVMLGAGMDTRAFRLPWPAGVVVYELDRDDVFDEKEPVEKILWGVVHHGVGAGDSPAREGFRPNAERVAEYEVFPESSALTATRCRLPE